MYQRTPAVAVQNELHAKLTFFLATTRLRCDLEKPARERKKKHFDTFGNSHNQSFCEVAVRVRKRTRLRSRHARRRSHGVDLFSDLLQLQHNELIIPILHSNPQKVRILSGRIGHQSTYLPTSRQEAAKLHSSTLERITSPHLNTKRTCIFRSI